MTFPSLETTPVIGEPTTSSLRLLQKESHANAGQIFSTCAGAGGGINGRNLHLLLSGAACLICENVALAIPVRAANAPVHAANATRVKIAETICLFNQEIDNHAADPRCSKHSCRRCAQLHLLNARHTLCAESEQLTQLNWLDSARHRACVPCLSRQQVRAQTALRWQQRCVLVTPQTPLLKADRILCLQCRSSRTCLNDRACFVHQQQLPPSQCLSLHRCCLNEVTHEPAQCRAIVTQGVANHFHSPRNKMNVAVKTRNARTRFPTVRTWMMPQMTRGCYHACLVHHAKFACKRRSSSNDTACLPPLKPLC